MKKKLKAAGVIVEYNPFHYGHKYHLEETKKLTQCDVLVAVMSPHFVQRGEPAIIDKWERTEIALKHGADLVIELPTHLTLQSAEIFAKSSVELLSLAKVETLVYGSEDLKKPHLSSLDKDLLDQGYSYAQAKNVKNFKPNQILGAYYEKYAKEYGVKASRILRTVAYHDLQLHEKISSASAIRQAHFNHQDTRHTTPIDLNQYLTSRIESFYPFIRYQILSEKEVLNSYLLVDEGIENLFYKLAFKYEHFEDFIQHATSRRYTKSRIQRTLMHILLKTPRNIESLNSFRVLGMNKTGQQYLNQIKKEAPVVTSFKNYQFKNLETKSTAIYSLINPKKSPLLKKEAGTIIILSES